LAERVCKHRPNMGALKMQDWKMQDWNLADQIAGLENAGLENAGLENRLESDELRLKQPQTSTTIDVSELSQNCVCLFWGVVCRGSKEAIAPKQKIICVNVFVVTEQYVTTNSSDYVSLNVTLSNRTWLSFQVRASSSATVGLTDDYLNYTDGHLYEIVFGLYGLNFYYTQLKYARLAV